MSVELLAEVESLDAVDEPFRALYRQEGEKYRLAVKGVEFPEDVAGLKTALQRERDEARKLKQRLAKMPEDFDPDKWQEMTEAQRKAEEDKAKQAGEWDSWKKQLQDQHSKALSEKDERIGALTKRIESLLVTSVAAQEIAKLEGSSKLLMPHVERMTRVVEDDGEFVARVVDERGDVRLGKSGEPMTIAELVTEMRESDDFAGAFKGSGAAGGGAPGRSATGGGVRSKFRTKADFTSVADKVSFIAEHGSEAYNNLPNS